MTEKEVHQILNAWQLLRRQGCTVYVNDFYDVQTEAELLEWIEDRKAFIEEHRAQTKASSNAGAVPRRGSDVGTSPLLAVSGLDDK